MEKLHRTLFHSNFCFKQLFSHFSSFYICIPQAPGTFHLIQPYNSITSTIPSPVNLSWSIPLTLGRDCHDSSAISEPFYSVYLAQSTPPSFFLQTSQTYLEVTNIPAGNWYWSVTAANAYFSTPSENEIWYFKVHLALVFTFTFPPFQVCVESRPTIAELMYPQNGQYVSGDPLTLQFYAPGEFGSECNVVISQGFYTVHFSLHSHYLLRPQGFLYNIR